MLFRIGGLAATATAIALAWCSIALADAPSDTVWLCKPGVAPDPCHEGLETTVFDSQGTGMLRALVRKQIDPRKRVRKLLVSAILLGGNVTVKRGSDVGGDFKHVRACHSPTQTRCVIAYSTFNETPPPDSLFGRPSNRFSEAFGLPNGPNLQVLCTNPAALGGGVGSLRTISRTEPFPGILGAGLLILYGGVLPVAPTPWIQPPATTTPSASTSTVPTC
jgi:hypothetical protein